MVISRAFSDLPEFLHLAGKHVSADGTVAAMKGIHPHEELTQLPGEYKLRSVEPLKIPGLQGERHLVLVDPAR